MIKKYSNGMSSPRCIYSIVNYKMKILREDCIKNERMRHCKKLFVPMHFITFFERLGISTFYSRTQLTALWWKSTLIVCMLLGMFMLRCDYVRIQTTRKCPSFCVASYHSFLEVFVLLTLAGTTPQHRSVWPLKL